MGIDSIKSKDKLNSEIHKAIKKIQLAKRKVGTLTNAENIDSYIDLGVDFMLYDSNQFIRDGIKELKNKIS